MAQDTVLIRHLSPSLSHFEKSDLLRHFGAVDVKIVGPEGKRPNLVYAKFENNRAAELAIQKLHQLNVLGRRISAELAKGPDVYISEPQKFSILSVNDEKQDRILRAKEAFLKKLGFSLKDYDFNQPPPLNIYYQYPPPTRLVLENICKAMANTPKLYNQVLHLMNKMNLPCPFVDKYPMESDLFKEKVPEPSKEDVRNLQDSKIMKEEMSEDESEMGSDTEHQRGEIIPVKRKKVTHKVMKRPKFLKPLIPPVQNTGSKTGLKPDDVFENAQKEPVQKKIEFTITADLSSIQEANEIQNIEITEEGFKVIKAPQKAPEKPVESENKEESNVDELSISCITAEQLAANRVSARDQRVLPVFKNYQPGAPSCRLYIKNLAKQVTARDLHFIYRRYYRPDLDQEQGTMFDIRLMQEGRMKGQAFITLQSVEQTQNALKETNGYILKDKPMVVQFARSATVK